MPTRRRGGSAGGEEIEMSADRTIEQDVWDMANVKLLSDEDPTPCTISLKQTVPCDKVPQFKEWQKKILAANKTSPGFQGATLIEENSDGEEVSFVVILRYDNPQNAKTWNLSEARTKHLAALEKITGLSAPSPAQISFDRDVPTFFNVLSKSKRKKGSTFWNDRRVWFCIWLQVFSLVEFFSYLLPMVLGPYYGKLHLHLMLLLSTFLTTLTIDLVTMRFVITFAKFVGFVK